MRNSLGPAIWAGDGYTRITHGYQPCLPNSSLQSKGLVHYTITTIDYLLTVQ